MKKHEESTKQRLDEFTRRHEAIRATILTKEEEEEAILEAKRKKWNAQRHEDYWKKPGL